MIYSFVIIIINPPAQVAAPPVVQEVAPLPVDLDPMSWHCPACGWWNTYTSVASLKNGSKQHLKRCPKK